jgi:hypothetical protein
MTLSQFYALNEGEQMENLWDHGVHITEKQDETFRYILYSLFSFFVELKYHMNDNNLVACRAFKSETQLEPYLPDIDISEIVRNL